MKINIVHKQISLVKLQNKNWFLKNGQLLLTINIVIMWQSHLPVGKWMLIWQEFKVLLLTKNCRWFEVEAFTVVCCESVNLIGYITVCYLLIVNSYASVHIARNVWTWCNLIKQFFSTCYLTFFFMQRDYGNFILKQLDYSPSFSTSDSRLGCASLTICS